MSLPESRQTKLFNEIIIVIVIAIVVLLAIVIAIAIAVAVAIAVPVIILDQSFPRSCLRKPADAHYG